MAGQVLLRGLLGFCFGVDVKGHFMDGEGVKSPHRKFGGWLCWVCFKSIGRPAGRPAFYGMQIPKFLIWSGKGIVMMVRVLRVLTRSFRGGFVFWVLGLVGKGHFFYGEGIESPHKKFWGWLCWICFKSIGRPADLLWNANSKKVIVLRNAK